MQNSFIIDRTTFASCRLEENPFCRESCRFIHAMAQSLNNALDTQLAGSLKDYIENNLSFQTKLPRLFRVNRLRLEQNRDRLKQRIGGRTLPNLRGILLHDGVPKTAALYLTGL